MKKKKIKTSFKNNAGDDGYHSAERQAKTLKKAMRKFAFLNDTTDPPLGLDNIYVKRPNGSYSALHEKPIEKVKRTLSAFHNALRGRDGR